jgi:dihydroorotate dehydrogenase
MTPALASALMPATRLLDAESAHAFAVRALRLGLAGRDRVDDPILAATAMGRRFANPIGLAAGFDKHAEAILPLMRLGFGFVEAGGVTPRPQPGNPRPRVFRLEQDRAIINRYGLNSVGAEEFARRLRALPRPLPAPLGVNVGVNKEGADPVRDYAALYAALAPLVDFVTINVSSPNTPGLRDLQGEERLAAILGAIPKGGPAAVVVKLAPDMADAALESLVELCAASGVAGLILANTTVARPASLRSPNARETGGLSGAPLRARATELLRRAHPIAKGRLALIGAGGVATPEHALEKIRAGASLVQLYTAFAYDGPALVGRLARGLAALLRREGFRSVEEAVGADLR